MNFSRYLLLTPPSVILGLITPEIQAQIRRPNIVFIMADDMGYECLGTYGSCYSTPHLDSLTERGVRFTHAYSQPLSTPSRVEVMTGRYNHKNYCEFGFLNQDQKTFGNLARQAGYTTAIVGKWQLGANSKLPDHFGFDRYCLWQLNYERSASGERYVDPLIEADGRVLSRSSEAYGPDLFVDYIERFIEENSDQPFLLYYPMVLVHNPFVVTPDHPDWEINPSERHVTDPKYFADMVRYCDKNVGRIVSKLSEKGLLDHTLIIFTGDNGTNKQIITKMSDGSSIRGGKGQTTDAGTHVALVATYGERQGPAGVCDDLIDFTDIMPTMAQAMEVKIPREWDVDGTSFLPQLCGKKGKPRKWVFCHYDSFFQGADKPNRNAKRYIRNCRYKLYSTGEFYDVERDAKEKHLIHEGQGSREAEEARKFLQRRLSKFPGWKVGDIPVKKVVLPGLEVRPLRWSKDER